MSGMTSGTNWDAISHPTLHGWFTGGSSESVANSVRTWQQGIGTQFDKVSDLIDGALRETDAVWEGGAAEAMKNGVSPLAQFARDAKDVSAKVGDGAAELARSYDDIKAKMPAPVHVTATDNALERGLSHLFGMKTDKEKQEESARQAEERARDLAKAYDSNVTTTMAGLPAFVPAPIVATDVGATGGGGRVSTTGIASAQSMVAGMRGGVEYNPISPTSASTSTAAAGPAGAGSGPLGPGSGNPQSSGGRPIPPPPSPAVPSSGPNPGGGRTGTTNQPKAPTITPQSNTPKSPLPPSSGRITSVLNPGHNQGGPSPSTSAPRTPSGPPTGRPSAGGPAATPDPRAQGAGGPGGSGGPGGGPRGGGGVGPGIGSGGAAGAAGAGPAPRGPVGPGALSAAGPVAGGAPVGPVGAAGPAGGRGPAAGIAGGAAPMAGAAGGQREEDKERRSNYLQETDDIWGSGEHVAPSVIGDLDTRP
ncbi:hypothetical protein [Streptoalloteichus hindustanus]|uniref:PPE-repeat protein n=1 Tax=Streptoalloteichus hindustanus TaxID=2017 RepID=A0A1M4UBP0_STRHI|nr:hypothetical protein [Streptoalloteichus hindustanus]SHE54159.1 PPE-repeat protein [Streptoalloteichus hindustanus]